MAEAFLTTQQAARLLGVNVDTMQRYLRQGKVRATRLGKFWRIPESALQDLASGHHQPNEETSTANVNAARMQEFLKLAAQLRPLITTGAGNPDFDVQTAIEKNRNEREKELAGE